MLEEASNLCYVGTIFQCMTGDRGRNRLLQLCSLTKNALGNPNPSNPQMRDGVEINRPKTSTTDSQKFDDAGE